MKRLLLLLATPLFAQKLMLLPGSVELTGPEARQQLVAEADLGDHQEDWSQAAQFSSSDAEDRHGR